MQIELHCTVARPAFSLQPPTSLQKGYGYSSYNCGHMITKVGQLEACLILAKAGEA